MKRSSLIKECVILILLGIAVPTFDVYSDGALTYELFTGLTHFKCHNGEVIRAGKVKDGYADESHGNCGDGSDGKRCVFTIINLQGHLRLDQNKARDTLET